jgi:hypothetical protein
MKMPVSWLAVVAAITVAGCQARTATPGRTSDAARQPPPAVPTVAARDTAVWEVTGPGQRRPSGLRVWEVRVGSGAEAAAGKAVYVHYVGRLEDGTMFDQSYGRGAPLAFRLGAGQVIRGWDEGIVGMRVGGRRKLLIPPRLAYGAGGYGTLIPPNATLAFQVELMDVR